MQLLGNGGGYHTLGATKFINGWLAIVPVLKVLLW